MIVRMLLRYVLVYGEMLDWAGFMQVVVVEVRLGCISTRILSF